MHIQPESKTEYFNILLEHLKELRSTYLLICILLFSSVYIFLNTPQHLGGEVAYT